MKLDKIKFARLVGMITSLASRTLDTEEIEAIDYVCEVEVPAVSTNINPEQLHVLMALMQEGTRKIDAIKLHRMMTGYGLKESKDAVEKYWPNHVTNADIALKLRNAGYNNAAELFEP